MAMEDNAIEKEEKQADKEVMKECAKAIGRQMMEMATKRSTDSPSNAAEEAEDGTGGKRRKSPKAARAISRAPQDTELTVFSKDLKEADMARIAIERETLQFNREKLDHELKVRQMELEERHQDREANARLEIEKTKMMIAVLTQRSTPSKDMSDM